MAGSGYTVWKALFPKEETLHTEIKHNAFLLRVVAADGIELSVPTKGGKDRKLILDYDHLDSLWELRGSVNEDHLTETVNQVWTDTGKKEDRRNEAQYWALIRERERREPSVTLPDEEANREGYSPHEGDERPLIERQIRERRGRERFRNRLREWHGDRCLVTGCTLLAVLEAAHIKPYQGEKDNHPENGLLLRSDIHTLFDLNLLGIEPDRLQVELHPSLANEYGHLAGKVLDCAADRRPSRKALKLRYSAFAKRLVEQHNVSRVGQ